MAKGVNKVLLLGNVGKDPEIGTTGSGMTIASFSLATADRTKENGEWVDKTEWHNLAQQFQQRVAAWFDSHATQP